MQMATAEMDFRIEELFKDDFELLSLLNSVHAASQEMGTPALYHPPSDAVHADFAPLTLEEIFAAVNVADNDNAPVIAHTPGVAEAAAVKPKKKKSPMSIFADIVFYIVILGAVMLAFVSTDKDANGPRNFFGYSYFTVLTGSMQKEIPRGSFVLTHQTDAEELKVGDTITFMKDASTTVTHKIVKIHENYDSQGARGFQTQGTNNAQPDREIVDASNVVGKVVFSIPGLGAGLSALSENLLFCFFFLGLLMVLSFVLQLFFKIRRQEKAELKTTQAECLPA